jgi:hypothetical protein
MLYMSILSVLGWVFLYWVCFVLLATVCMGLVACVGMMILGDDVTDSKPGGKIDD